MTLKTTRRAAILLGSVAFVALAVPAQAKPGHHGHYRHYSHHRHADTRAIAAMPAAVDAANRDDRYPAAATAQRSSAVVGGRNAATAAHSYAAASAEPVSGEATQSQAYRRAQSHANSAFGGFTTDSLVTEARKYIGTNPTGRGRLWCGAFMDLVLKRTGHAGGGNLAWGYSRYGKRVAGPQVGAIAVMHGHVGVVSGLDPNGNPIIVSGNHNHTVAEAVYPRRRIAAYVLP